MWRKLHNKKPHNMHSSGNIIRVNKQKRMKRAACVPRKAEVRCMFQTGLVYWSHKPFRLVSCRLCLIWFRFLFRLKCSIFGPPTLYTVGLALILPSTPVWDNFCIPTFLVYCYTRNVVRYTHCRMSCECPDDKLQYLLTENVNIWITCSTQLTCQSTSQK